MDVRLLLVDPGPPSVLPLRRIAGLENAHPEVDVNPETLGEKVVDWIGFLGTNALLMSTCEHPGAAWIASLFAYLVMRVASYR